MQRFRLLLLVAVLCAAVAACGETDPATEAASEVAADSTEEATGTAAPEAGSTDDGGGAAVTDDMQGVTVEGDLGAKPDIQLPGGEPPSELVVVDLEEGDGAEATAGAEVTTHYVGVSWLNDGEQFDASWDKGEPITFPLSGVIQGWQEGIPGMRVGGRRMLIIPPEMAYGSQPPPGAPIAPDDTLVFVIDLEDVG